MSDDDPAPPPSGYLRIHEWKFEDLRIMLGSDLLVFRAEGHPAVSLHLHDSDRQLSALTCLDYWLDNVLTNTPETGMQCTFCFFPHLTLSSP